MKKVFAVSAIMAISPLCSAQTCPPGHQVFIEEGGKVVPHAPFGWHVYYKGKNHLRSTDVQFSIAHWGDKDEPNAEKGRIRCHYGNPDISNSHYGVTVESDTLIARSRVSGWGGNL